MKNKPDIILCRWVDITGYNEWRSKESALKLKPTICFTAGAILQEDKHLLKIAGSWDIKLEEFMDVTIIPKGVVKEIYSVSLTRRK